MNVYKRKLIIVTKNNAKERMHKAALKVIEVCQTLKVKVSEEQYLLIHLLQKNQENMSSLRRKNALFVNSMNFRQHQAKETTSKLQPHMLNQASSTLRTLQ